MDPINEYDILICLYMFFAGLAFGAIIFVNLFMWPVMGLICFICLCAAYSVFMENPARDE